MISFTRTLLLVLTGWLLTNMSIVSAQNNRTLFRLLPSSQTGVNFKNQITESDSLNILNQANIYNGGGVGVGRVVRDGVKPLAVQRQACGGDPDCVGHYCVFNAKRMAENSPLTAWAATW